MARITRLQKRGRPTKRPGVRGDYSTGGGTFTITAARTHMPKLDERGYPDQGGVPTPVLVESTVVA